jgi:rod shape-determining protein MreD
MEYPSERLFDPRDSRIFRFRAWVMLAVPLLAILLQVYLRLFFDFFKYLDLPLLITIYLAMMRRSQTGGLIVGAVMGLAQDSLMTNPLGMYGICKTLVGYFAASIGLKIDAEQPLIRLFVTFMFFLFHQFLYWVLQRALLAQPVLFELRRQLLMALLNAIVGVILFQLLDKLRDRR